MSWTHCRKAVILFQSLLGCSYCEHIPHYVWITNRLVLLLSFEKGAVSKEHFVSKLFTASALRINALFQKCKFQCVLNISTLS